MIYLAVGRGPSPLFGDAKLGTKKKHPVAVQQNANDLPTFCQRFAKKSIVLCVSSPVLHEEHLLRPSSA